MLTKKLDNLINALHGGKEDFSCQYVSSLNSSSTQTDSLSILTQVSSSSQTEEREVFDNYANTSITTSDGHLTNLLSQVQTIHLSKQ